MPRFSVVIDVDAPPRQVWAALVDWPAHGRWVPLTAVRVLSPSAAGAGARFVARTAVGPVGFDDVMEVTDWCPPEGGSPGYCRVAKVGRVVRGAAWFDVAARAGSGFSRVTWTEDVEVVPVGLTSRLPRALTVRIGRALVRPVLRRMAADVARGGPAA